GMGVKCPKRTAAMVDLALLESRFKSKYPQEQAALDRLAKATGLEPSEKGRLKVLRQLDQQGLVRAWKRRQAKGQQEIQELLEECDRYGARVVLRSPPQRAGDFLNNQLRGQWAEQVALSMAIAGLRFVQFGPSGSAMPGEEDHREVMITFREIGL